MRRIVRLTESDIRRMVYSALNEARKKGMGNFTTNASDKKYIGPLQQWLDYCAKLGLDSDQADNAFGTFWVSFLPDAKRLAGQGLRMWNSGNTAQKAMKAAKRKFFYIDGEDGEQLRFNMDDARKNDDGSYDTDANGNYIPVDGAKPVKQLPSTMFGPFDMKDYIPAEDDDQGEIDRKNMEYQEILNNPHIGRATRADGTMLQTQAARHINAGDGQTQDRVAYAWLMGTEELGANAQNIKGSFPLIKDDLFNIGITDGVYALLNNIRKAIVTFGKNYADMYNNDLITNANAPTSYDMMTNDPTDEWGNDINADNNPMSSDNVGLEDINDEPMTDSDKPEDTDMVASRSNSGDVNFDIESDDEGRRGIIDTDDDSSDNRLSTARDMLDNWEETGLSEDDKVTFMCIDKAMELLKQGDERITNLRDNGFVKFAFQNLYSGKWGYEWFKKSWARCMKVWQNNLTKGQAQEIREAYRRMVRLINERKLHRAVNESIYRMLKSRLY